MFTRNRGTVLLPLWIPPRYRLPTGGCTGRRLSYDVNDLERIIPDGSGINVVA